MAVRDTYDPTPTYPTASTVWTSGDIDGVSWDASLVPYSASNISRIDLYRLVGPGDDQFVTNLTENVDPRSGSIAFAVPDIEPGDSYFISVGGIGGSTSATFQIQPRDTIPVILSPDGSTVWTIGGEGTIVWDVSQLPEWPGPIKYFLLFEDPYYDVGVLAGNIDPTLGNITVQVPTNIVPGTYFILPEDGYQTNVRFQIVAQ